MKTTFVGDNLPKTKMMNLLNRVVALIEEHPKINLTKCDSRLEIKFKKNMGNADGATDGAHKDPYEMTLRFGGGTSTIIASMAHEYVHVKQMVDGRLLADDEKHSITFDKEEIPGDMIILMRMIGMPDKKFLPYEAEAYDLGPKIAIDVLAKLTKEEMDYVRKHSDDDFDIGIAVGCAMASKQLKLPRSEEL